MNEIRDTTGTALVQEYSFKIVYNFGLICHELFVYSIIKKFWKMIYMKNTLFASKFKINT